MARARQSPEARRHEQLQNTAARSAARQSPEVRRHEQLQDTAARSAARQSPEVRRHEQLQDTAARSAARQSPEVRRHEQLQDTAARSAARQSPEVRRHEQLQDTAARSAARQSPKVRRHEADQRKKFFSMSYMVDPITGKYQFEQPCGLWNQPCKHGCGYMHLSSSLPGTRTRCCADGLLSPYSTTNMDVLVNFELDEIPLYLMQCIERNSAFSRDCSIYNNLLAMAATKVCNYSATSGWMQRGPGSASVTLNGRLHHYFPTVNSSDPSCGLSYFIFDDDTAQAGFAMTHNVDQSILCILREGLKLHNPYCINLRQLGVEAREQQINSNQLRNIVPTMPNQPRHLDICSVINSRQNNHLVLEVQETDGSRLCDIPMDSIHVEPLCFPLLFPCGHAGWTREMKKDLTAEQYLIVRLLKPEKLGSNFLTALAQHASARVDCRTGEPFDVNENEAILNEFQIVDVLVQPELQVNRFQLLSRLGQYFAMDFYSRVLDARIDCIQHLSNKIMMGQVRAKTSAALAQEEVNRRAGGFGNPDCINKKKTYVPDSTHGSPRHMAALAKNALVLVSEWGCPHVFLTLTCNPNWPEITSQLLVGQTAFDRPDVVCPVFKARLDQFKHNIRQGKYFQGRNVTYMLHVIEYQFRGLPHAHMVIRLTNCFEIDDDDSDGLIDFVNKNFIAEMPRFAGEEYQNVFEEEGGQCFDDEYKAKAVELVCKCNIHRCAVAVNACKRKETDQCRRGYDRSDAIQATYIYKNKSRMVYRRRNVADDLLVVPYNLPMLMDWGSHINVEYSGSAFSVLYIYKYLYKGASKKEHIELNSEQEHDSEDEIKLFIYGRVMCSMAAFWRLYGYQDYPASEPAVVSFKVQTGAQLDDFFQHGQMTDLMVYYNRPVVLHHQTYTEFWELYNANSLLPKYYQERPGSTAVNGSLGVPLNLSQYCGALFDPSE